MPLIIELSPELESRLEQAASRQGIAPGDFARKLIETALLPMEPTAGARLLAELKAEGALGIWQDRTEDSAELARELRRQAEGRERFQARQQEAEETIRRGGRRTSGRIV